jgi:uncharacterized protein YjbJ (UPF0337 family)
VNCALRPDTPEMPPAEKSWLGPMDLPTALNRHLGSGFIRRFTNGDAIMDRDRIQGSLKQVMGRIKEAIGKAAGDRKTEAEGKTDQAVGKLQNAVGGVKDTVREAFKP